MLDKTIYDKKYSKLYLEQNDFLIKIEKQADLIIKELAITRNDTVLDIGCGNGFIQQRVTRFAKEVIGIDINPSAIEANPSMKACLMDATRLEFEKSRFDKIYSSHTIEHIRDLSSVFREVDRVLKPGGLAFFIYPWELWRGMAHARGAWKMLHNPFLGYKFHVHRLNPKKVIKFTQGTGLTHVKSKLVFMRTPQWTTLFEKRV